MRTLWITLLLLALVAGKPTQQEQGKAGEGEEEEEGVEGVEDQRPVGAVDPNLLAHGGEAAVHDAINEALLPDAPLEGVPLEGDPEAQAPLAQEDPVVQAPNLEASLSREDESVPDAPPPPPGPMDPEGLLHEGGEEVAHPAEPPTPVGSVDPEKLAHGDKSVHAEGDKKDEAKEVPLGATSPEELVHGEQQVHGEKPKMDQDGVPVGQADPEALVHGQGHVHQEEGAQEVRVGAMDPETLVHGKEHAHEEAEEGAGDSVPVGSVNPEYLAHGDAQHGEQGQGQQQHGQDVHASKVAIGSVDPETLLHEDEGGHVHQNPKLTLDVQGRTGTGGVRVGAGGEGPGEDDDLVHRLMHGEEPHEHAPPADRLSAETLRQLKLDPELLKHMDLDKLFDTMQQDYQQWQQDGQQDSSSNKQNVMTFEITSENLMEELADKYHLKDKARLLDPQATDEWEAGSKELERPAKGEDSVQHRLEMAANTEPLRLLHHRHKGYTLAHKHMHEEP